MMEAWELLELYQLLRMYKSELALRHVRTEEAVALMGVIANDYRERTEGKDIKKAGNPRGGGRKRKYTQEQDQEIIEIYAERKSMRETAAQAGCSLGHVQDVMRRYRENKN